MMGITGEIYDNGRAKVFNLLQGSLPTITMATDRIIYDYLEKVAKAQSRGNATEHTYRPALKTPFESFKKDVLGYGDFEPCRI